MLKATFSSYYRKGIMNNVFVYIVTGSAEELAKYKEVQSNFVTSTGRKGVYTENEEGQPLFFSTRPLSDNRRQAVALTITGGSNPRVVADDTDRVFAQEAKLDDFMLQKMAELRVMQAMTGGSGLSMLQNALMPQATSKEDAAAPTDDAPIVDEVVVGKEVQS